MIKLGQLSKNKRNFKRMVNWTENQHTNLHKLVKHIEDSFTMAACTVLETITVLIKRWDTLVNFSMAKNRGMVLCISKMVFWLVNSKMISSTVWAGFSGINEMAEFMLETSKIANSTGKGRFSFRTVTFWKDFGRMGTVYSWLQCQENSDIEKNSTIFQIIYAIYTIIFKKSLKRIAIIIFLLYLFDFCTNPANIFFKFIIVYCWVDEISLILHNYMITS